ncbi:MAG: helix-turn-helix transcriptional regulator [Alphaproteobacteria bacterium]|nr:helix-turn-helix transcriptional regulator [Alphaproteobacteria bacterium]
MSENNKNNDRAPLVLGDKISKIISIVGVSPEKLAEKAGVEEEMVEKTMNGDGDTPIGDVAKIAGALNVDTGAVIDDSGFSKGVDYELVGSGIGDSLGHVTGQSTKVEQIELLNKDKIN